MVKTVGQRLATNNKINEKLPAPTVKFSCIYVNYQVNNNRIKIKSVWSKENKNLSITIRYSHVL